MWKWKEKKTREHKHSPLSIAWMKQLTASERGFWKCINGDESEAVVEVTTKSGVSRKTRSDIPYICPIKNLMLLYCWYNAQSQPVWYFTRCSVVFSLMLHRTSLWWCELLLLASLGLCAATPPQPVSILITYCRAALYSHAMMQCF